MPNFYHINDIDSIGHELNGLTPTSIIDIAHDLSHRGVMFSCGHLAQVAAAGNLDVLIQTGVNEVHVLPVVSAGGDCTLALYQGTTFSAAGTALTLMNHLFSSAKVSTVTATHTPTITLVGTQKGPTVYIPGGTGGITPGGQGEGFTSEVELLANTVYLLRVTNLTGQVQYLNSRFQLLEPGLLG